MKLSETNMAISVAYIEPNRITDRVYGTNAKLTAGQQRTSSHKHGKAQEDTLQICRMVRSEV